MIEAPNVDELLAGPLGDWLAKHGVVREHAKEETMSRYFKVALAGVVVLPFIWLLLPLPGTFNLFITFAAIGGGLYWGYLPTAKAKKEAKVGINDAIAGSLGLTYEHDFEPGEEFEQCQTYKLVPKYNRSSFEDRWTGSVGGHDFGLYEALLEEKRGSGKNTRWVTVFRGAIIGIAYGKTFHGTTLLQRADKHRRFFGGHKDSVKFDGHELGHVDMVHPGFEDRFAVWSDDQVEAHYLIHPTYVERLIAIEDAFHGKDVRSVFIDGNVIIAIEGENLFESGSIDAEDDRERIEETVSQFVTLASLATSFNEDSRS